MRRRLWTLLAVLTCVSGEYLMGGHLDNNAESQRSGKIESASTLERKTRLDDLDLDLVAEESSVAVGATAEAPTGDNDGDAPRYHIPFPFAFNGGKPFSLEKDPITGKIDFEKAPPVKALNYTDHYREDKEDDRDGDKKAVYSERKRNKGKDNEDVSPNEINTYTNFHDFLNLPVHYSSNKYGNDKYPLISSSYANTKVQSGANSYNTYNHRPYHSENDLYAHPIKNSYAPITKTSTHQTTVEDDKAKWTDPSTITTSVPITTTSSRTMLPTSTKAPAVTTWKPSNTPIAFHSIDRTEMESDKNLLPIEKLHASSHPEPHRNPSNPMRTPNNAAMTEKTQASPLHKDHSNLDNFVVSHTRPETKPAQNEEDIQYRDSYDTYELPEGEGEGEGEGEADSNGNSEESDYSLFQDLLKDFTSVSSTTTSPTASTAAATTITTTTITTRVSASSAGTTTAATTVMPLVSSTPSAPREDTLANSPSQFPLISQHPIVSSSLNSDRRQSVTERYDDIISHGYRSTPMPVKLEANRIGGTVIESTSNIVIPPDQNVVSFVLGNRQSVEGGYYSVGTAVGENLYGGLSDNDAMLWPIHNDPQGPTKGVKQEQHLPAHSVTELSGPDRNTQKWWPPSPLKASNEIEPMKSQSPLVAISSAVIQDEKNRSKERDSGYVVFPDDETKDADATTEERIVIVNEADGSIRELITPKTTTLTTTMATTMNKTKPNVSTVIGDLPQLAEDLIPPAESSRPSARPSYFYHYQYDAPRPEHSRLPQRSPLSPPPPRIKPHSVPPLDPGLRKRPYLPDTKLPNILPQFRPNAKASYGHRGPDTIGTMPAGQGSGTRIRQPSHSSTSRRPLFPPSPSYLQRLNPPPPSIHAIRLAIVPTSNVDNIILPHETESVRTRLRPPHATPSISRVGLHENKLFGIGQGAIGKNAESRKEDHGKSEMMGENEERYPEEPPMTPPRPPLFPKRRTADPPRVATLQMIQHHGELIGETDEPVEPVLAHEAERRKSDDHDPAEIPEQPVYVVYPVNTAVNIHPDDSNEKDGSVVVGTRGPHRPLPPDTLLQNEPADEAHTVYNGRPLVAQDFPYPLERPDPTSVFPVTVKETPLLIPSKQRQQQTSVMSEQEKSEKDDHVDTVNVIPYLQEFLPASNRRKNDAAISVTLHRTGSSGTASTSTSTSTASTSTSMPIAYVYTPTHAPYSIRLDEGMDDEDGADVAANVDAKQTVLLPSQQPSSSSSSAPAPQNFMAPFVASISAEMPGKNGWSVVVVEPPADRKSDNDDGEKLVSSEMETQTERNEFDVNNFKPQLIGGFKPIYEFPTEDAMHRDVADTNTEIDIPRHSKELLSVSDKG